MRTQPVELSPLFERRHFELALFGADSSAPVHDGDIVAGKYRVDRVLGAGGMGVVVAGTHVDLGHKVAIKFVRPSALNEPGLQERFLREARTAARLKSEHVAKVLDVGKMDSGVPYIVMELLEGCDLAHVVSEHGALSVDVAASYVAQACEAVAEAHALGVVHRDIKPQNLFLTTGIGGEAVVKVLDFGASKGDVAGFASLTQSTTVIGSPLYMSPEQMRCARDADARSDVWSLGIVLFELLTGRVPFDADSMPALCLKVVNDLPPSMTHGRLEVPAGLVSIVMRCLAKDPAHRFRDAGELGAALAPFALPVRAVDRTLMVSGMRPMASLVPVALHAEPVPSARTLGRSASLLVIAVTALLAGFLLVYAIAGSQGRARVAASPSARAHEQSETTLPPARALTPIMTPIAIPIAIPIATTATPTTVAAPPSHPSPPKTTVKPAPKTSAATPRPTPTANDDDIPAFR